MKYLRLPFILLLSIWWTVSSAQIITTEPAFPVANDSLTIIYDATEGNGGLADFDGDVYLHTGLITDQSNSGSDWKYVPYDWNEHNDRVKATPLGNNKWQFTYLPTVRSFFEVTNSSEKIERVAIVFKGVKNGNVVAEGKDTGNTDIFIDVVEEELSARFVKPAGEFELLRLGETLEIEGITNASTDDTILKLLLNGQEVAATETSASLTYTFEAEEAGNFEFELLAEDGSGRSASAMTRVVVTDASVVQERPAGLQDGITYHENGTSISLSLFAPGKKNVFVIGDFNDWQADFNYLMKKDSLKADSVWHWIEIEGLNPEQEYGFQYLVDGQQRLADPYSSLVLDPYDDQYISDFTFPNLKAYPEGKTTGMVSLLQLGKEEYEWEVPNFEKPDKENLVIYELLLRDFLETSNFQTLTDSLDYLENLGVNAIELMPVSEFDGNLSWGYNPGFHLALDKYYGTPEAFKKFVDEAHKRGIAVILDVVMNHATNNNPFYQLYGNDENFYFNSTARHSYNVFNDFDHSYSGTQYYTKQMIKHWIEEYKIDGFRWDLTKGFTQNCSASDEGCTGSYQQDRVDILKKYADWQWAADSTFIVIFEHLGTESEEKEWANYRIDEGKGVMMWGNMNYEYNEATMGYESDLTGVLAESRSSFEGRRVVGYMESHDEQWLMFKNLNYGNTSDNYHITYLLTALDRQKLAGAFFFTLPGPKMIWQFGELGYGGKEGECLKPGGGGNGDCAPSDPGRTGQKPIRWEYFSNEDRKALYDTWSDLIHLRKSSPAFTDPENAQYNLDDSIKTIILEHSDSEVVIVGNFGVADATAQVSYPSAGTWYNYYEGSAVEISNTTRQIELLPGEFKIFTTREFESSLDGIPVSNKRDTNSDVPQSFSLSQNYPNPFNPSTVISYQLAENSVVSLKVYDMLGREVAELANGRKVAGSYQVSFDASTLSSGMYIYRLKAGSKVFTQKMMLIK